MINITNQLIISLLAFDFYASVLSKLVGPVGKPDISYECPTKNVRVSDQMSDRKYKNIHLVEQKKRNTSNHKRLTIRLYIISLFL